MAPEEVQKSLSRVASAVITSMYTRLFGKPKPGGDRASREQALVAFLSRDGAAKPRPGGWTPEHEAAAAALTRTGGGLSAIIAVDCLGLPRPEGLLGEVLEFGAVMPTGVPGAPRDTQDWLWAGLPPWRATPAVGAFSPKPAPRLRVAAVDPSRVHIGPIADAGRLASSFLALRELCETRELKLRADGWPAAAVCKAVEKALQPHPSVGGQRILYWAWMAGLVAARDGRLRAGAPVPSDPVEILRLALDGLCSRALWLDDLPTDDHDVVAALLHPHWGDPDTRQMPAVRSACRVLLSRLDTDDWVPIEALIKAVTEREASIGFMESPSFTGERLSPRDLDASEARMQRVLVESVFCHTFRLLGLVEVGALDAPYTPPERPPRDSALDRAYRGRHTRYLGKQDALPAYAPPRSSRAIRRTPLGREVLGLPVTQPARAARVHVGADFEVHAPARDLPLADALWLDRVALVAGHPGDPVRRWRLDRKRWGEAMQGGLDGRAGLARLGAMAERGLPDNVRVTIEDWTGAFGVVQLNQGFDLAEWPSRGERDKAIAALPGARAAGERFALLPLGAVKAPVVDYLKPPPRWLRLGPGDEVAAVAKGQPDLLGAGLVARICHTRDGAQRLDPAKLRPTTSAAVLEFLTKRAVQPPPDDFVALVAAYTGEITPPRARSAELLLVADEAAAQLVMALPGASAHLVGWLGGGVLEVKKGHTAKLRKLLAGVGVEVGEG